MKRLLVLLTVLVLLSGCVREKDMGIEFTEAGDQHIGFGALSGVPGFPWGDGNDDGSLVIMFEIESFNSAVPKLGYILGILDPDGSDSNGIGLAVMTDDGVYGTETLIMSFRGWTAGAEESLWSLPNSSIALNTKYVLVITYNSSDPTNDPVIYLNSATPALTQESTGTAPRATTKTWLLTLGADVYFATRYPIDGFLYYVAGFENRILTAEEALSITEQRSAEGFNPSFELGLSGAAGVQQFGGTALAAGNVITENINGYSGVPTGSPVGYADDFLHIK